MNSCPVTFGMGFLGTVKGTTAAPYTSTRLSRTLRCAFTSTGKMVYDAAEDGYELTLAPSATQTLDLSTGLTSPLGESINGALDFSGGVYAVMFVHDPDSLATTGVRVFGAGTGEFQGPIAAAAKVTLLPGQGIGFVTQANKTGWTMDAAGARKILLENLDATALHVATVWAFIMGKV